MIILAFSLFNTGLLAQETEAARETRTSSEVDWEKVPGIYWCEPVENGWHIGEITIEKRDAEGRPTLFRWRNQVGRSWRLFPDSEPGVLRTGEENPYHADYPENGRVFQFETSEDSPTEITGFNFLESPYRKQPPSEAKAAMTLPKGDWLSLLRVGTESVTVVLNTNQGKFYISLHDPKSIDAIRALPSEEAQFDDLVSRLQARADNGDKQAAWKLGLLSLYGVGVSRDLPKAERLFRSSNPAKKLEGLGLLARLLADKEDEVQDIPQALELARELRDTGKKRAIPALLHLGQDLFRNRDTASLAGARQILEWILEIDPEEIEAQVELALLLREQKDYAEAWEQATAALTHPGLSDRDRAGLRAVRLTVAQRTGKLANLEAADFQEPVEILIRRGSIVTMAILVGVAAVAILGFLALLAFVTRRTTKTTPGIISAIVWGAVTALAMGPVFAIPLAAVLLGLAITAALILSLRPDVRKSYFPLEPRPAISVMTRTGLLVLGCLAITFAFDLGYGKAYEAIMGKPLDLQLVATFLQTEGVGDFLMMFLVAAVFIPTIEEIIYRGFLLDWLRRRQLSWTWAILISSVVFGLAHGMQYAIPTGMIGILAGLLKMRTGNLWVPILLHGLINGIAIVLLTL